MSKSLVSVIIPTYKGGTTLKRAIDSIINQTYRPIEIIVVDDNDPSAKERGQTEKIIGNYTNIKYIKHEINRNGAAARNTGIYNAKGEYLCFLDDDDFYLPDRIKRSVETLKKNQGFDVVYCGVILTKNCEIKDVIKAKNILDQKEIFLNEMVIGTGSNLFMTRRVIDRVGGFDEKFYRHQDLEFMVRLLNYFRVINLNEELIVKATNGINNTPEYKRFAEMKELFFAKFTKEINQLNDQDKQRFFCYHYNKLLAEAFKSKDKSNIADAINKISKYRKVKRDEKIQSIVLPHRYLNRAYKLFKKYYLFFRFKFSKIPVEENKSNENIIDKRTKEMIFRVIRKVNEE